MEGLNEVCTQSAVATLFPAVLKDLALVYNLWRPHLSAECFSSAKKRLESELWILIFYNHLPETSEQGFSIYSALFEYNLTSRGS